MTETYRAKMERALFLAITQTVKDDDGRSIVDSGQIIGAMIDLMAFMLASAPSCARSRDLRKYADELRTALVRKTKQMQQIVSREGYGFPITVVSAEGVA